MEVRHRVLGGVLLVSGTTIGAGMLALPVVTGLAGFFPTVCLFLVYWCFMTYTAFLLLEVNLWLGEGINLITMAHHTLGRVGEAVSWVTYLFLLYLLTTAYLAGGGPILAGVFYTLTGIAVPGWVGAIPLLLIFGFFVYEGTKYVDVVNRLLMLGLVVAYGAMALFIVPHIEESFLSYANWKYPLLAVSVTATSFGFHIIIPTLTTYLHHNVRNLVKAILIGSIIPLIVYLIWEAITLGVIPVSGENGMIEGYEKGYDGVKLLVMTMNNSKVALIAQFFSFFAIVTSFLGVTLSLTDFLADGIHIKKTHTGRIILFALTFLPPLVFILTFPRAFLSALQFAGAFGVVVLFGLLPPFMVWSGRYRKGMKSPLTVPGGKIGLIVTIVLSLTVIGIEVANQAGWLKTFVFSN